MPQPAQVDGFCGAVQGQAVGDQGRRVERALVEQIERARLLRGRARVGADDLAFGPEDLVDVEGDAGIPGRVREEHDTAAWPGDLERQVEGSLAAGRVEDGVGAAFRHVVPGHPGDFRGGRGGVGAQFERHRSPIRRRLGDDDPGAREGRSQDQQVEKAHRAGAEHRDFGCFTGESGAVDATQDAGGRFDEHGGLVGESVVELSHGVLNRSGLEPQALAETSRIQQVFGEPGAHRFGARTARAAVAAGRVVRRDNAVAERQPVGAALDHPADHLVSEHLSRRPAGLGQLVQIGTAEAATDELDQRLAVADPGLGRVDDLQPARGRRPYRLHGRRPAGRDGRGRPGPGPGCPKVVRDSAARRIVVRGRRRRPARTFRGRTRVVLLMYVTLFSRS